MRKRLLMYCLLLLTVTQLSAQTSKVTIQPAYPKAGDVVTISYNPGAAIPGGAGITLVFTTSNIFSLPSKIPLQQKGYVWQTSFTLPHYAVYATFTIQYGDKTDQPTADQHYALAVYNNKGERVKDGYMFESGSLPYQMGKKAAGLVNKQLALLEKELSLYPDNYEAKLRLLMLQMSLVPAAEKEKYRTRAHEVITAKFMEAPGKMAITNKVTMGYYIIGENSRVDSIRKVIRTQYPNTEAAYEYLTDEISKEENIDNRINLLEAAIKKETPANAAFFSDMHEMLFAAYAQKKNQSKALYHLQNVRKEENPYLPEKWKKIALVLEENNIALDTALKYATMAYHRANQFPVGLIRYFPETGYIIPYVPDSVKRKAALSAESNMLSIIAQIKYKQGKKAEADQDMQKALAVIDNQETLTRAAHYYTKTAHHDKAFNAWWKVLVLDQTDTAALTAMKQSYVSWKKTSAGLDQKLAELETIWREALTEELSKERINIPAPSLAKIVDLKGNLVPPQQLQNKVIVIDFWATWCVPCMEEMPYLQAVYNKYKNNPDVVFMVINSGARNTLEDAQKWFGNKVYSFPVYYNSDRTIGEQFGFNVIPATYVIDKNGKIQFKSIGFEGPRLQHKLDLAIDLVLSSK